MDASTKNALDVNIKKHNITVPTQDTNKVVSEILSGMQIWLDTKSHIPLELKQKFLELGSNNLELFIKAVYNKFNNKWIVKEFIDNTFVQPREESNKYLADSGCDSAEQLWTKIENLRISENSTDESEDDEISEASANKLGEKVKLNNGTEIEVKAILKNLPDKEFVNMALKRVEPNTSEHCYKKK